MDDERDLDFIPGQKRSRRVSRKSTSSMPLSTSLPASSGMYMPKDSELKVRLERSRRSARECRARKKLRYQYLDELIAHREKAIMTLRSEFAKYLDIYRQLEQGIYTPEMQMILNEQPTTQ